MKKSIVKSVAAVSVLVMLSVNVFAGSFNNDNDKTKKSTSSTNMAPNGNYKHVIPTSPGNKLKYSFTKPEKEKANRNYKQQNQEKRNVKFKDNFTNIPKNNNTSYKHPHGL
jgi:hypothetical protein